MYALLFSHAGLSTAQISLLLAIWSAVGFVAEVPAGVLADRFSRRGALASAGGLQAAGYALWVVAPHFWGFAAGFVLWGLGAALVSGALQALLFDGLRSVGAEEQYGRVAGRVASVGLVAQLPAAVSGAILFAVGGYRLVGWVSVGCCLGAAGVACLLPEPPRHRSSDDADAGYVATLREGLAQVTTRSGVRVAAAAVAVLGGLDALEEYFPLLAHSWRVPTGLVPLAVLGIPLVGAAGAGLGARAARLTPSALLGLLVVGGVALGVAGIVRQPLGLVAVAGFYGLYRLMLVVVDVRLQDRIVGTHRATVTSVAALGTEVVGLGLYGAWALGGLVPIASALVVVAASTRALLRLARAVSR